jgi:pyridoxal 5'-phosphate synthase pdxT subunit
MNIGILALQGGIAEHSDALKALGIGDLRILQVRTAADAETLDGLILPGGESTVQLLLLEKTGLLEILRQKIGTGLPVWGTCAGMILLAQQVEGYAAPAIGCMDMSVKRNMYGSQLESFIHPADFSGIAGGPIDAVFIRAPGVVSCGAGVEVLARVKGVPIAVREKHMLATAFHPELTGDTRVHQYYIDMVRLSCEPEGQGNGDNSGNCRDNHHSSGKIGTNTVTQRQN